MTTRITQQQLESYLWGAATLLRGTGYDFVIDPEIEGRVYMHFASARFENVFIEVCNAANATYRLDGHTFHFVRRHFVSSANR